MDAAQRSQRNVDLIIAQIRDYMDTRSIAATRINPRIGNIYEDIAYQQLTQMRLMLAGGKAFGPVKISVADILLSDDDKKIRDLFNPTNQVSIMTEIVEQKDEDMKEKRAGILKIHDMPTMYSALDPSLEKIILLIQCWIWWDLEDSMDLVKFDTVVQLVQHLDQAGVNEQMVQYYAEQFRMSPTQMSRDVIVAHELGRAAEMVEHFQTRRESDEGYKVIIKREDTPQNSPDQLIRALAQPYRVLDMIREHKQIDDATRTGYAKALGVAPEQLTLEQVAAMAERAIIQGKERLKTALSGQGTGGRPFDYKKWQLERMRERYETIRAGRQPQKLTSPKPDGGGARR
jgi:hypothetical protein